MGAAGVCHAADLSGNWITRIIGPGNPQYARVALLSEGSKITGTWNGAKLEAAADGGHLSLSLLGNGEPAGTLTETGVGDSFSGQAR